MWPLANFATKTFEDLAEEAAAVATADQSASERSALLGLGFFQSLDCQYERVRPPKTKSASLSGRSLPTKIPAVEREAPAGPETSTSIKKSHRVPSISKKGT